MPELPDVEGFRDVLASCAQGRTIRGVDVHDTGVLHDATAPQLRRALEGHRFAEPERRGKWLLAYVEGSGSTSGSTLLMHFGMTGRLVCCSASDALAQHDRVVFTLEGWDRRHGDDRQLRYRDQRKLKGLWLADDAGVERLLGEQGPDAAELSRDAFEELLSGRRGGVKSTLTDQSVLAGLGNLLADEILWQARLHPSRRTDGLGDDERQRLHKAMRGTLRSSMRAGQVPPRTSWLTGQRDRDPGEAACPRCGGPLRRGRIAGRSTVWCPACQPARTA